MDACAYQKPTRVHSECSQKPAPPRVLGNNRERSQLYRAYATACRKAEPPGDAVTVSALFRQAIRCAGDGAGAAELMAECAQYLACFGCVAD